MHSCTFFSVWLYSFNVYLSLTLSTILITHFYYLNNRIFLKTENAIFEFSLKNKKLITTNKIGIQEQYPHVYCAYQSRFLVIINFGKRSLVIFKDSLVDHSLSKLNRLLNA